MTFAALEQRINSACTKKLSNCAATVAGTPVTGIFDHEYIDPLGIDSASAALTIASADVPAVKRNDAVVVNSVNYTVATVKPDGTGLTVLLLQKV